MLPLFFMQVWRRLVTDDYSLCENATRSMWNLAAWWNSSKPLPSPLKASSNPSNKTLLHLSRQCRFVTPADTAKLSDWLLDGSDSHSYQERSELKAKCPIILDQQLDVTTFKNNNTARGCDGTSTFLLYQWDPNQALARRRREKPCQAFYLHTHPVVEHTVITGAHDATFGEAYGLFVNLKRLPDRLVRKFFIDSVAAPTPTTNGTKQPDTGYYIITDATLLCDPSLLANFIKEVLDRAKQSAQDLKWEDSQKSSIQWAVYAVVLATLLCSTVKGLRDAADITSELGVMIAQWFNMLPGRVQRLLKDTHRSDSAACCGGMVAPRDPGMHGSQLILRWVVSTIVYETPVFLACLNLWSATTQKVGLSLVDGYPSSAFQKIPWPYNPCADARTGVRALGYVETATMYTEQQTCAVALICAVALLLPFLRASVEARYLHSHGSVPPCLGLLPEDQKPVDDNKPVNLTVLVSDAKTKCTAA